MFTYPVACASALGGFLILIVVESVLTFHTIEDEHRVGEDYFSSPELFVDIRLPINYTTIMIAPLMIK